MASIKQAGSRCSRDAIRHNPAFGIRRTYRMRHVRRTCAKLCRAWSGDFEQIQFLPGHASIQTTERYLGSRRNLKEAGNDRLGLALG
jgi:integrase